MDKRGTIYFTIIRKPYTVPIQMKRPNSTVEEVMKEFPDAKILNSTHFENGCGLAQAEIQNKLGNRFGNESMKEKLFPIGTKVKVPIGKGVVIKVFEDRDMYDIPGRYLIKGKTAAGGLFELDFPRNSITRDF